VLIIKPLTLSSCILTYYSIEIIAGKLLIFNEILRWLIPRGTKVEGLSKSSHLSALLPW